MTTISAALLLFLILDPLGNIPVLLSLLKPLPAPRRRLVLAARAADRAGGAAGFPVGRQSTCCEAMHLRQESVSIAGGIVLFLIGIKMIFPQPGGMFGESRRRALHRANGDPDDRRAIRHGSGDAAGQPGTGTDGRLEPGPGAGLGWPPR